MVRALLHLTILAMLTVALTDMSMAAPKDRGLKAFSDKKYDSAIIYFRRHLRRNSRDFQVWNLLGASLFHSGQPEVALKYFQRVIGKTIRKSYNYYYQGLCYEVLESKLKAKQMYQLASHYNDEYGQRSVFQIAVIEYHERHKKYAKYWANQYLMRFPGGIFRQKALQIIYSLDRGKYIASMEGAVKPDMVRAIMKFHPLSLFKATPHFWFLQGGYSFEDTRVKNPNFQQASLVDEGFVNHSLNTVAALGAGPIRRKGSSGYVGYKYIQNWVSDNNRVFTWMEDMTDYSYFPFRPDLLERRHQIFGRFEKEFPKNISFGTYGIFELAFVGNEWFFPEQNDRKLRLAKTYFLLPWVGYKYNEVYEASAFLYLRNQQNFEEPAFSNKSYSLFDSDAKDISFGLSQRFSSPSHHLQVRFDLYHYGYTYNDYWLDHQNNGGFIQLDHEFIQDFHINALVGGYVAEYDQELIRYGSCNSAQIYQKRNDTIGYVKCKRSDNGLYFQVGLALHMSRFERLSGKWSRVQNSNDSLKVFESTRDLITFEYTLAFPGIEPLEIFLQKFGDLSNTKRIEL